MNEKVKKVLFIIGICLLISFNIWTGISNYHIRTRLQQITDNYIYITTQLTETSARIAQLQSDYSKFTAIADKWEQRNSAIEDALRKLTESFGRERETIASIATGIASMGRDVASLKAIEQQLSAIESTIGARIDNLKRSLTEYQQSIASERDVIKSIATGITRIETGFTGLQLFTEELLRQYTANSNLIGDNQELLREAMEILQRYNPKK